MVDAQEGEILSAVGGRMKNRVYVLKNILSSKVLKEISASFPNPPQICRR